VRKLILILILTALWQAGAAWPQVRTPNEAGVALGHWHTIVRDVDATRKFWMLLGGTPIQVDGTEVVKFPGVLIFLTPGSPSGPSKGSTVNHVGFGVQSVQKTFAELKAASPAGVKITEPRKSPLNGQDIGDLYTSDGLMIEVTEEAGVSPYPRLPPDTPIESNHMHFFVPEPSRKQMQTWYVKLFGGIPGELRGEFIVDIPGVKFMRVAPCGSEYSGCPVSPLPTKGRALDHIGFEVKNLEAFCKKLKASGVKFDQPYSKSRHKGFASAELTDPWGTSIELTEGLNRF
jgi:catechol 2,3-dioxygenase-like lactoylglutathione lyase family enzyme